MLPPTLTQLDFDVKFPLLRLLLFLIDLKSTIFCSLRTFKIVNYFFIETVEICTEGYKLHCDAIMILTLFFS